jgi:isoaspartyl peptidase/L-asparaginase-like protein (Ntn-hydrolase superfamily)
VVPADAMISPRAKCEHKYWLEKTNEEQRNLQVDDQHSSLDVLTVNDTVGAVALAGDSTTSAGVSRFPQRGISFFLL